MTYTIDKAINDLKKIDISKTSQPLPDDFLISNYEKATSFIFPEDYKVFLKSASNVIAGSFSALRLNPNMREEFGELQYAIKEARENGMPVSYLPICEDNSDYYCFSPDGKIRFWSHDGASDESWPDLATWIRKVWIEQD